MVGFGTGNSDRVEQSKCPEIVDFEVDRRKDCVEEDLEREGVMKFITGRQRMTQCRRQRTEEAVGSGIDGPTITASWVRMAEVEWLALPTRMQETRVRFIVRQWQ